MVVFHPVPAGLVKDFWPDLRTRKAPGVVEENQDRMGNPGGFLGSRKTFLLSQKPEYALAVKERTVRETISLIQRRYFKRYPIDLPHNVEPSDEHLASVDDDAADPEVIEAELDSDEEDTETSPESANRATLIKKRKEQIKRWFGNQYRKDNDTKDKSSSSPYAAVIRKLTGQGIKRPQSKHAMNHWRKTQSQDIELRLKTQLDAAVEAGEPQLKSQHAAIRENIAWKMYRDLPKSDQEKWEEIAASEHKAALDQYNKELTAQAPTGPKDRQEAIQALSSFVIPILDAICDATGWKATLIAGGPEPADGGRLNVMSIHSGTTTGAVKMNFGSAERQGYIKNVVPLYGRFLKKCYSPEECRLRSLPDTNGAMSMEMLDLESDTNSTALIHTVQDSGLEGQLPGSQISYSKDISMGSPGGTGTFNDNPFPFGLDGSQSSPRHSNSSLQPSPVSSRSQSLDMDTEEFDGTLGSPILPLHTHANTSVHLARNMGPPSFVPQDSGLPAPIVHEQEIRPLAPPMLVAPPSTVPAKKKGPTQKKKAAPKAQAILPSAPPVLAPTKPPRPVPQRKNNTKRPALSAPTTTPSLNPAVSAAPPQPASVNLTKAKKRKPVAPSNPTVSVTLPVEPAATAIPGKGTKRKGTYTYELGGPIAPRDINTVPPPGSKRVRTIVQR